MKLFNKILSFFIAVITAFTLFACSGNKKNEEEKTLSVAVNEIVELTYDGIQKAESASPSILTVSANNGKYFAKGISEGETEIVLTQSGKETRKKVEVYNEEITLNETELTLGVNETFDLIATTKSGKSAKWASSKFFVADVDQNGKVTAKGNNGTTVITATSFGVSASCTVTVQKLESTMTVDKTSLAMLKGDTYTPSVVANVYDKTQEKFIKIESGFNYSVDKENVVAINDGVITAIGKGEAEITVTVPNNSELSATINVTVKEEINSFSVLSDTDVNWYGRVYKSNLSGYECMRLDNTASSFEVCFSGSTFTAEIYSNCSLAPYACVKVYVDGKARTVILDKNNAWKEYTLATGLSEGIHTIKVVKMIEDCYGQLWIKSVKADKFYTPDKKPELKIDVYGDSITAGYAVLGSAGDVIRGDNEDGTSTYAYITAQNLNAQINVMCYQGISLSLPNWITDHFMKDIYKYYSYSSRKTWDFSAYVPDIIMINLGTNDSGGIGKTQDATTDKFKADYTKMIQELRVLAPNADIICLYGMMSMNENLKSAINSMVKEFNTNGDTHVHKIALSIGSVGGAGHPGVNANLDAASTITEYIKQNILAK